MVVKKLLEEFDEDILRLYVQKNSDYYLAKWKVMASSESKISWNWAAFLFTASWLGYRKLYLYAFIYILINIATLVPLLGFILWIGLWVGIGLYGNYLYAVKTYENLVKLKSSYPDEEIFKQMVVKQGGTSVFGILLVLLMGMVVYGILFAIGLAVIDNTRYSEF